MARTVAGSMPRVAAMWSIARSIPTMPCGPPKPRKAVLDWVLVLQRYEVILAFGRL